MKFIHILRDGRDVVSSFRKNKDSLTFRYDLELDDDGEPSIEHLAFVWKTYLNAYIKWENDKRCYLLRYEELILNPEDTLSDLCKFIGIEYDTNMMNYYCKGIKGRVDKDRPHHSNIIKPLKKSRVFGWKKTLSKEHIKVFEDIASSELDYYGYDIVTK